MTTNRDEFVFRANPNEWLEVSDELNESIEVLLKNSQATYFKSDTWDGKPTTKLMSSRSIFLLMGFSIENLIKGILIFDRPELVNEGKLDNKIKSHNLKHLALNISDVKINTEELKFLDILSEAIPDWGRYPCPLKFQQIKNEVEYSKRMNNEFQKLRKSLRNKLIERLKKGWISGLENERTNVKIISISDKN